MRLLLHIALPAALLLVGLAAPADAAVDPCATGILGNRVCVDVSGVCASVGYAPPFTDFGLGASQCPLVHAGSDGVTACETVLAGYWTIGGFFGLDGYACVLAYEDETGRTCVLPVGDTNLRTLPSFQPVCR